MNIPNVFLTFSRSDGSHLLHAILTRLVKQLVIPPFCVNEPRDQLQFSSPFSGKKTKCVVLKWQQSFSACLAYYFCKTAENTTDATFFMSARDERFRRFSLCVLKADSNHWWLVLYVFRKTAKANVQQRCMLYFHEQLNSCFCKLCNQKKCIRCV